MNLEQIKNDYAVSKGYYDFYDLLIGVINYEILSEHINKVMILTQKECLKRASDNAYTKTETNGFDGEYWDYNVVDKESITNENNIIK